MALDVRHTGLGLLLQAWLEDQPRGSYPRPAEPRSEVQPGSQVCMWKSEELGSRPVLLKGGVLLPTPQPRKLRLFCGP